MNSIKRRSMEMEHGKVGFIFTIRNSNFRIGRAIQGFLYGAEKKTNRPSNKRKNKQANK
jgi:hypothetical protein